MKILKMIEELEHYYSDYGDIEICIKSYDYCGRESNDPITDMYIDDKTNELIVY